VNGFKGSFEIYKGKKIKKIQGILKLELKNLSKILGIQ
jgi:hypothetical protein